MKSRWTAGGIAVPNLRDWYFLAVELQIALSAGVPFVKAVSLAAEDARHKSIRRAAEVILAQTARGSTVKAILTNSTIPPLMRNLMAVGLRGGDTPAALVHVIAHYGRLLDIRGQILRMTAYPAILVAAGTLIMILRDATIASLRGGMSPGMALIKFSLMYGLPILGAAAVAVIAAWFIFLPGVRPLYDRVVITAPVIGKMVRHYCQAVFMRVLASLLESGMPVTDAWNMAVASTPNSHMGQRLEEGLRFLQDGESMAEALRQSGIMDKESRAMAAVGEAVGSAPSLLQKYAEYRETEVANKAKILTSLLGIACIPFIALGYFQSPIWLGGLAFVLVFLRRAT